ncbi:MAG: response regulator [Anaerolineae bacterium]|nr:response regulator [Anaerolineae bacterium]
MNERILIIDDNVTNLKVAINTLESYDYSVLMARNGRDGLHRAIYAQPDLILLDIKMPDMDGYEVCRQLKADEQTQQIPVIFISALHEVFDKMTAFSIGGVDYITKPFQTEELLARVKTHLDLRRLQQELQDTNETLEEKVRDRTAELAEANDLLQAEIEQRKWQQQEKDRLFAVVSQQSDHLRNLTTLLIQAQQSERQGLAVNLKNEMAQKIELVQSSLNQAQLLLSDENIKPVAEYLTTAIQVLTQMSVYVAQITNDLPQPTAQEQAVSQSPLIKLSGREREVLQLLAQAKSNQEISEILNISVASVYTYNRRIKDKLDLRDLPGLIKFALDHDLLE